MSLTRIVALQVTDEAGYARYREEMAGLLAAHGGEFLWDYRVAEAVRPGCAHPVNRLFALDFPDAERADAFFAHPDYLRVRARWFEPAVAGLTVLARFTTG